MDIKKIAMAGALSLGVLSAGGCGKQPSSNTDALSERIGQSVTQAINTTPSTEEQMIKEAAKKLDTLEQTFETLNKEVAEAQKNIPQQGEDTSLEAAAERERLQFIADLQSEREAIPYLKISNPEAFRQAIDLLLCFGSPTIQINSEDDANIPYPCGPKIHGKTTLITYNQAMELYLSRKAIAIEEIQSLQAKPEPKKIPAEKYI